MKQINGGVVAAKGFKANAIHSGLRKNPGRKDLSLIVSEKICTTASVYTTNLVKGAPIIVTKKHSENGLAQAIICNSGNANTCNADGVEKALKMCEYASKALGLPTEDILIASTGVIGQVLNIEPVKNHINELVLGLSNDPSASDLAWQGICTTDTKKKEIAFEFELDGHICHIGGICKGSGMIKPNMATMLCFITTDCNISSAMLQKALSAVIQDTFNMVSVDGDTSTNDTVTVLANGLAGNDLINEENDSYKVFYKALEEIAVSLCKAIAKDGEGATKLLVVDVLNAKTKEDAKKVAKSVVMSSLLKAAMFGADANWGRVLCAIGYSEANVDIDKVDVSFESRKGILDVCKNGAGIPFSEEKAKEILLEDEITIRCNLNDGLYNSQAYGCDLTYDYVKINGDYRS